MEIVFALIGAASIRMATALAMRDAIAAASLKSFLPATGRNFGFTTPLDKQPRLVVVDVIEMLQLPPEQTEVAEAD
jgi:hypothetical protein